MAIHDQPFYHKTISNVSIAIGALFNNLKIVRYNKDGVAQSTIAVPIRYERKEHWFQKLNENIKKSEVTFQQSFPRINYTLETVVRDTRKSLNRLQKLKHEVEVVDGDDIRKWHYVPVPHNILFNVSIMTKYMDDSTQILEQILPYFNPTVNLKITEILATETVNDVKVSLLSEPQLEDNYIEGFEESRFIVWNFRVSASTNLYQPVRTDKVIRKVIVDIDHADPLYDLETITVEAAPDEYVDKENSTITIEIGV